MAIFFMGSLIWPEGGWQWSLIMWNFWHLWFYKKNCFFLLKKELKTALQTQATKIILSQFVHLNNAYFQKKMALMV